MYSTFYDMNSRCDILFVVPATIPDISSESMGTLILAKIARNNGYDAQILRYWEVEINISSYVDFAQKMTKKIIQKKPKVLSFYCRCAEYHICIDIASKIKSRCKDIIISFGGPQAELVAFQTLTAFSFVDFVCCGEGETTIVPFLDIICKKKTSLSLKDIPGLVYREPNNVIKRNDSQELLCDNYRRPFQYYDLIPNIVLENSKIFPIDVGRGCPFACTFCSTKTFWKRKYRLRNTDDIIEEIIFLYKNYKVTIFSFEHDLFTVNKNRIADFCQKLIDNKIKIYWGCSSRIDTIDEEMIDLMYQAGLRYIYYGIETGSQKIQKQINKNIDIQKCKVLVRYSVEKGINVTTSLIYGFPEETRNTFEDTLSLIYDFREMGVWYVQTHLLSIMNGTYYYNKYHDKLFLSDTISNQNIFLGFSELKPLIKSHPTIFPSFYDFYNKIRFELKCFHVFDRIWDFFPHTINNIFSYFKQLKKTKYDVYKLFLKNNGETFVNKNYSDSNYMSELWCFHLLESFIKNLSLEIPDTIKFREELLKEYDSFHKSDTVG